MIDHIDKTDLPNPFAGTSLAVAPALPTVREPKTITVRSTPAIKVPSPVKQSLNYVPAIEPRRKVRDANELINLASRGGELLASFLSDSFSGIGTLADLFAGFFAGFASSFALSPPSRARKPAKPMPLAKYAVPAKFGTMVFSRM